MFFNSSLFIINFLGFFGIYHARAWQQNTRVLMVLSASLLFYAVYDYHYLPLLIGIVAVHYYAGNGYLRNRRAVFGAVVGLDIIILLYFKFFRKEFALPLGLSFYIFQCLSWLFDIRSGKTRPELTPLEFAGSVTYFPHLPAGPLLKTDTLKNTFQSVISWDDCKSGIFFFVLGMTKKTVADLLAPITDMYLRNGSENWTEAWTGGIAGLARMYGDFSGYTDMALGLSLLLGFRLPINFYRPFSSPSVTIYYSERWHISLARWIREYLFLPLSLNFSRKGIPVEIGILVSFLVMSLWHGSNLTFLVWGTYIAILIVFEDRIKLKSGPVGIIRTNFLVMLGLIIFYAADLETGVSTAQALISFSGNADLSFQKELLMVIFALSFLIILSFLDLKTLPGIIRTKYFWPLVYIFSLFSFVFGTGNRNFIYLDF